MSSADGGKAIPCIRSVEDGGAIIKDAVDTFGGVHVLVNNAGILRDKAFQSATDADWDLVYKVHMKGTYATCKAAWPIFQKQVSAQWACYKEYYSHVVMSPEIRTYRQYLLYCRSPRQLRSGQLLHRQGCNSGFHQDPGY